MLKENRMHYRREREEKYRRVNNQSYFSIMKKVRDDWKSVEVDDRRHHRSCDF